PPRPAGTEPACPFRPPIRRPARGPGAHGSAGPKPAIRSRILLDLPADAGKATDVLASTDTDLTRRAAAGDREAFERVYAESLPAVWSFASRRAGSRAGAEVLTARILRRAFRSEEHTSELQSRENLVCRLLLEKKNIPHQHTVRRQRTKLS